MLTVQGTYPIVSCMHASQKCCMHAWRLMSQTAIDACANSSIYCVCCIDSDIKARAEGYLGGPLSDGCLIHMVRDVAPNKRMFCISFRLPEAIAYADSAADAAVPSAAVAEAPATLPVTENGGCGQKRPHPSKAASRRSRRQILKTDSCYGTLCGLHIIELG